ncbi:MAG TPA: PilZ domain-containing protein [Anaerohalosphaeraceae bacterium]|nr:PilZ domain-containing protein [Anaerohalosphaeraceae bacterium]HOL89697.1 PilZ domain-containing protein [Anaerohalosphaeraceae bacterium]HPP55992.1 PilZ domain-containing protein [Anaerohalosphaeraceae bacterium]
MESMVERRAEKRLRYSWPVWFAEDYDDILTQGQMIDISSSGAAFSCYSDRCPSPGEHITARFSIPQFGEDETFGLANFIRDGRICRVDQLGPYLRRVAVQFSEPLPFKPAESQPVEQFMVV